MWDDTVRFRICNIDPFDCIIDGTFDYEGCHTQKNACRWKDEHWAVAFGKYASVNKKRDDDFGFLQRSDWFVLNDFTILNDLTMLNGFDST